jgi:hypothetical protein
LVFLEENLAASLCRASINSLWSEKGLGYAAGLDVCVSLGQAGIDDAALLGRVFVVRGRGLRKDADHAAGDLEFDLLAALKAP